MTPQPSTTDRHRITCRGMFGSCGQVLAEIDGDHWLFSNVRMRFVDKQPWVTCPKCGRETRLTWQNRPSTKLDAS
jgi:RNase P subunit RPR2